MVLSAILLDSIFQFLDSMLAGAVGAAIELPISHFHTVSDDDAAAVLASRRQSMDRAFEAVEYMPLVPDHHRKSLIIFVSTDFTLGHLISFLLQSAA